MEIVKEDWSRVVKISKYDGEEYLSSEFTLDEATQEESIKRKKLKEKGYDVDSYDQRHDQLTQEYLEQYPKMNHIMQRSDLYDEYEKKKKDLAKEFFGIELENVVMY